MFEQFSLEMCFFFKIKREGALVSDIVDAFFSFQEK